MWESVRKRREGRGISAREMKDRGVARGEQRLVGREREREQKESRDVKCFGKWFTENFSVNRFPNFCEGLSNQLQTISIDFYFTAKQTPANDENVLRKMFYVETNGVLNSSKSRS
jgi:hypothetical protein